MGRPSRRVSLENVSHSHAVPAHRPPPQVRIVADAASSMCSTEASLVSQRFQFVDKNINVSPPTVGRQATSMAARPSRKSRGARSRVSTGPWTETRPSSCCTTRFPSLCGKLFFHSSAPGCAAAASALPPIKERAAKDALTGLIDLAAPQCPGTRHVPRAL